jgi:hypothetical protein
MRCYSNTKCDLGATTEIGTSCAYLAVLNDRPGRCERKKKKEIRRIRRTELNLVYHHSSPIVHIHNLQRYFDACMS